MKFFVGLVVVLLAEVAVSTLLDPEIVWEKMKNPTKVDPRPNPDPPISVNGFTFNPPPGISFIPNPGVPTLKIGAGSKDKEIKVTTAEKCPSPTLTGAKTYLVNTATFANNEITIKTNKDITCEEPEMAVLKCDDKNKITFAVSCA